MVKALFVCNIIGEEDAMGASIEDFSDSLEVLLSGCIPDLEFD